MSDWKIKYDNKSEYKCQVCKNPKTKTAIIYAWYPEEDTPQDYLIHELLHIAVTSILYSREHDEYEIFRNNEESLIQDICKLITEGEWSAYKGTAEIPVNFLDGKCKGIVNENN